MAVGLKELKDRSVVVPRRRTAPLPVDRSTAGGAHAKEHEPSVEAKEKTGDGLKPVVVDVTATAGAIVDKGETTLHQSNAEAVRQATLGHGGKSLSSSPQMARFTSVDGGTKLKDKKLARDEHLGARARRVLTTAELDVAARDVLQPLMKLIEGTPDPARFNAATWAAFQRVATLEPALLEALGAGLCQRPPLVPDGVPDAVVAALHAPGVDRATLALLARARALTQLIVAAELPSLSRDEVAGLSRVVHDEGYFKEQAQRLRSPTALLCPTTESAELLDAARLALLAPAVRARFSPEARAASAGTEAAMPRLTLADLMQGGAANALAFLQRSGKDVERPWAELGGLSPKTFLAQRQGESDDAFRTRLGSKQVLNPFAASFDALEKDAQRLGALGGEQAAKRQLAFLNKKQEQALAPALLLACTPALFSAANGATDPGRTLGGLLQLCWRVGNPQLSFSDPLVSRGIAELGQTHGEQLQKDVALGRAVVHAELTRALSGLRDDTYDARLKDLLTERGIPVRTDPVAQALGRLVRDAGADNPALQEALAKLDRTSPEHEVVAKLHALRHDPGVFPLGAPRDTALQVGELSVAFPPGSGPVFPEVVGATSVAYRVTLLRPVGDVPAGESVLVRVPKGARLQLDSDGALKLEAFDARRLQETSSRAADFEVIERRVRVTRHERVDVGGVALVLERRAAATSAAAQLQKGARLSQHDVDALADQYLRGLCDVDTTTRPHGVFYELGPDNYVMDARGIRGSYVDVAMMFRTERERAAFGFFQGGYSSAGNWIIGSNVPLSSEAVQELWRSTTLPPEQQARRQLFVAALSARLDPNHPVYRGVAPEVRSHVIDGLTRDARFLGLTVGSKAAYDLAAETFGVADKKGLSEVSRQNVARLRQSLGKLSPGEERLIARIEAMPLRFTHRLTAEKLAAVLEHGGIGTLASMKDKPSMPSATPQAEVKLYGAEHYVFGFVGFWTPPHKFGDIALHLKDEAWQQRSWASCKSGYEHYMVAEEQQLKAKLKEEELVYQRYDAPSVELVAGARRSMKQDVFLPEEFAATNALELVALLRRRGVDARKVADLGPDAMRRQLTELMDDEYLVQRRKTGFLEAKVKDDVALSDIRTVEIPDTPQHQPLIQALQERGVAVVRVPAPS